jgi:peptidoglycan/LPS O-acetylase OafA/YrhL
VFWARRALRIFPLFYLYLAVTYLYGRFGGFAVEDEAWAYYLVHLANVKIAATDFGLPIFGVLWSLAVEEQFYALYPLVVRRLTRRHLAWLCASVIVAAPFVRIALYHFTPLERHALHVLVFCRADTLAIGALVGLAWESETARARLQRVAPWLLPPALAVLASVFVFHFGHWVCPYEQAWTMVGYTSVGAACAVILVVVVSGGAMATAVFANPVIAYLGKISYGIYLWHCLVGSVVANLPGIDAAGTRIALFLLATITVSAISFHLWETPFLRRKVAFAV